jgi:glycosyltransferase involved in cell wall biosynthesis
VAAPASPPTDRPLRILVAANILHDRRGGMSRIMGSTGDVLAAAGHQVDYFCAEQARGYGAGGRLARFTYPAAVLRHARSRARRGEPYDIVNCHEPSAAAIALGRRLAGNPRVVVWTHGVERRAWRFALEEAALGREGPALRSRLAVPATLLWQAAIALRNADHVFCMSAEDRAYLEDWLGEACPPITRINAGADRAFAAAAADRDYGRARALLFAGTWRKNKGIEDLVPAVERLLARRPDLTFTALGAGVPPATVLGAFAPGVRGRVRCVTAADDAETARVLAAHDLFVLPSLFEGTPLTLVEAMASGLPVVTTATCGMKDVIRDGQNGLLVPVRSPVAVADGLEALLDDRGRRERLGRRAQSDALERYTWDRIGREMLETYLEITSARDAGRDAGRAARP